MLEKSSVSFFLKILRHSVKYLSHLGAIPEVDLNNDDDDNEGEVKKSRKKEGKKDNYPLEVDTYGLPVIPDVEDLSLESKKCLIRTFLTKHYSQFHK